jgi:hypothetical protein
MKPFEVFLSAALLSASATSAHSQSFTTRQIPVSGTASIRPAAPGAGVTEVAPALDSADLHGPGSDDRRIPPGPGAGIPASSAAISKYNPELKLSFGGLRAIDSRLADGGNTLSVEPPDQGLCASNGFVLESVNNAIRVYSSDGSTLSGVTSQNTFYGYPVAFNGSTGAAGPLISDPVCYFDPDTQRWFHVVITFTRVGTTFALAGPNRLDLAVSQTSDPLGAWNIYKIPTQNDGTEGTPNHHCAGGPCFADYPKIGADANGIYITSNEYPLFGGSSTGAQIYAMSKRALAAGGPVTVVQFDTSEPNLLLDGNPGFGVWPATAPASTYTTDLGGTEYFLSATNLFGPGKSVESRPTTDNRLRIWALSNTESLNAGSPALVLRHGVVEVEAYSFPPPATQREGNVPLADCLNDDSSPTPRGTGCWTFFFSKKPPGNEHEAQHVAHSYTMQQVVYADGKLWGALGTALRIGTGTQAGIAWFIIRPQVSAAGLGGQVVKQGYLGLANNHLTYPSVGVTAAGRGVIAFTLLGADYYPSAAYATLDAVVGVGEIHITAEGLGPDDGFSAYKAFVGYAGYPRWGDYGATAVDGDSIWIGSEYIGQTCTFAEFVAAPVGRCGETRIATGNWHTRISKIVP